jgi:TonB family protein
MNRTQKKCLIVSAALHLLLPGIIIFGAALMPEDRSMPFKPIKLYSLANVTDAPSSGGSPNAVSAPLPPAAQLPAPAQPAPPEQPTPRSAPVPTREPEAVKPPPKFSLNQNELKLTKRSDVKPPKDNQAAVDKAAADKAARQAAADARSRLFRTASQNIKSIGKDFSPTTAIELSGPGDGGPAAANYRDIVASKYTAAWTPPASLDDDSATVTVSVTISRDGTVASHRIVRSSGNRDMDRSIENTLDNVTYIEAFPASSNDQERTYTIKFNLAAKRSLG